jgi:succinyl-CoA synthetase beta subunit
MQALQLQQKRYLNIHEYQGAQLMAKFGINVPDGAPAFTVDDVKKAADSMKDAKGEVRLAMGDRRDKQAGQIWCLKACVLIDRQAGGNSSKSPLAHAQTQPSAAARASHPFRLKPRPPQVVLKSQILAGGRGLGKFTSGLQGGVHICSAAKAVELAKQMLGGTLVTKQTGPAGKPVNTLYVAKKMQLKREMYFAILLDRATAGPVMIGCRCGVGACWYVSVCLGGGRALFAGSGVWTDCRSDRPATARARRETANPTPRPTAPQRGRHQHRGPGREVPREDHQDPRRHQDWHHQRAGGRLDTRLFTFAGLCRALPRVEPPEPDLCCAAHLQQPRPPPKTSSHRPSPQALQMAKGLACTGDIQAAADQIKGLYKLFDKCDCTMVEVSGRPHSLAVRSGRASLTFYQHDQTDSPSVLPCCTAPNCNPSLPPPKVNPLAEDEKGRLIAADAKIGFDDNAAFRQKEIFAMRDESQMDPR